MIWLLPVLIFNAFAAETTSVVLDSRLALAAIDGEGNFLSIFLVY